jgi:hypothetical protein
MATTDNSADDKKAMDVAKPGKSTPDTTARPVIVTHKPMVQDPMVKTEETPTDVPNKEDANLSTHTAKTIKPLNEKETPEPAEDKPAEASEEKPEQAGSDAAVVDAVVDQAAVDKKKQNEADDAAKAKQAALAKLIEEKKYFVKVGQVARRRNNRIAVVFVLLVVVLIGGYLAIDAGIIKTSINLPVHVLKK